MFDRQRAETTERSNLKFEMRKWGKRLLQLKNNKNSKKRCFILYSPRKYSSWPL